MEFLEKKERCGRSPPQACNTMLFLIPKNVTSEQPIALLPTLVRWWEGLRAPDVMRWRGTHLTGEIKERSALCGRLCSICKDSRTVQAKKTKDRKRLAEALERFGLPVAWAWATHFNFTRKSCECCAGTSSIRGTSSAKNASRSRSKPSRPFSFVRNGAACSFMQCCKTRRVKQ